MRTLNRRSRLLYLLHGLVGDVKEPTSLLKKDLFAPSQSCPNINCNNNNNDDDDDNDDDNDNSKFCQGFSAFHGAISSAQSRADVSVLRWKTVSTNMNLNIVRGFAYYRFNMIPRVDSRTRGDEETDLDMFF